MVLKGLRRLRCGIACFVGPDGIYALPRWLIYLAMAWIVFEVESWLLVSIESHVNAIWWRMMIEASRAAGRDLTCLRDGAD